MTDEPQTPGSDPNPALDSFDVATDRVLAALEAVANSPEPVCANRAVCLDALEEYIAELKAFKAELEAELAKRKATENTPKRNRLPSASLN